MIQPEFADLVRPLPALDRVVLFDRRGGAGAWWRVRRELRAFAPELCIDAQGNLKSAAATWLSGAPRRAGLARVDWRERAGARVLNDAAPPAADATHALERMLHLARHVAGAAAVRADEDWLALSDDERARGRAAWRERMGAAPRRPVVLQLSAPGDVRAWPVERQRELLRALAAQGRDALALSGPGEAELGAAFARELPDARHWVGQRGLRELAAFLTAAAEAGARFVGVDSGPLHLAAACGLPVVGLAGPQDPARTGPWPVPGAQSPHAVVRATPAPACAPCLARRCHHAAGPVCMSELSAAAVAEVC